MEGLLRPFSVGGGASLKIVQVPSPNYWTGRKGYEPIAIVIHTMSGTLVGCDAWFQNQASQVSSHYGVGLDGTIHQYVGLGDSAWANGILETGNKWSGLAGIVNAYGSPVNPNYQTVSIETEDDAVLTTPVTDAMYVSVLGLVQEAMTQFPSIKYLVTHSVISPLSRPDCPNGRWTTSGRMQQLSVATGLELVIA